MIIPRQSIGSKKSLFTSPGCRNNDIIWMSLRSIMVNGVPREVRQPKTLGACRPSSFGLRTSRGTPFTMITPRLFQIMFKKF